MRFLERVVFSFPFAYLLRSEKKRKNYLKWDPLRERERERESRKRKRRDLRDLNR
jgi:hypothetical protein